MNRKGVCTLAVVSLLVYGFADSAVADGNIAEENTVASRGDFFTGGNDQSLTTDLSTLTDKVFFKKGHPEDQGPVWWIDDGSEHFLKVFLGPNPSYKVNKIAIQVGSSNDYVVSWDDKRTEYLATNPQKVVIIPDRTVPGMAPPVVKRINAVTDAFKIERDAAGQGGTLCSVSEFQAFGGKRNGKDRD